jgi:hypothetical protein
MSTSQKPDEGPAVKFQLTPKSAARLQEIKARNAMVQAIAGESWGAKLTPLQQRAFAEYLRRFNLDISEIDNLGGRPYRNGRYYMRRIAELAAQGRVEWYKGDHLGPDARLDAMATAGDKWAVEEKARRVRECIRLGVPDDATVVYLVTVKMKELSLPTEGVKWFTPGREKLGWSKETKGKREMVSADPVGEENPVTSTETRAWRRCGRLAAAEIPELRDQETEMEFAASETQAAVIEEAIRAEEEAEAEVAKPVAGQGEDPYADHSEEPPRSIGAGPAQPITTVRGEAVPVETDEQIRQQELELLKREAAK